MTAFSALTPVTAFRIEADIYLAIWIALLAVKLFAFLDAAARPAAHFVASEKQTKTMWLVMLGGTLILHLLDDSPGFSLLAMIGAVVAFVYLADVRPTLRAMRRR